MTSAAQVYEPEAKHVLSGWCEGPNHRLCKHVYTSQKLGGTVNYTCECECHTPNASARAA